MQLEERSLEARFCQSVAVQLGTKYAVEVGGHIKVARECVGVDVRFARRDKKPMAPLGEHRQRFVSSLEVLSFLKIRMSQSTFAIVASAISARSSLCSALVAKNWCEVANFMHHVSSSSDGIGTIKLAQRIIGIQRA